MTDHAHNFVDITDQVFGDVRVIEFECRNKNQEAMWRCLWGRCNQEFIASGHHLRRDKVHMCNAWPTSSAAITCADHIEREADESAEETVMKAIGMPLNGIIIGHSKLYVECFQ